MVNRKDKFKEHNKLTTNDTNKVKEVKKRLQEGNNRSQEENWEQRGTRDAGGR